MRKINRFFDNLYIDRRVLPCTVVVVIIDLRVHQKMLVI